MPQGSRIVQLKVWNDCLFAITKKTSRLLYASRLGDLSHKVTLKPHPSFIDCRIKKLAFGEYHMFVLTEDGVVFTMGDNDFG
jgi:alpha-tubulin suppressor-like RCC1 family protein